MRDALEGLASEAAADERADALVARPRGARQHEVERHPQLAARREQRREGERTEIRRGEQQKAVGQRRRSALVHDVRAPVRLPRADERDAEPLAERDGIRLLGEDRVGAGLDREARRPFGPDRAAETVVRLEQDDVGRAALDGTVRGREPRDPPTDHGDGGHGVLRTTSASRRMKSG